MCDILVVGGRSVGAEETSSGEEEGSTQPLGS